MEKRDKEQIRINGKLVSIITTILCFIVIGFLYITILKQDLASERDKYGFIAKNESEHIIKTIDSVLARTGTLKALIMDHNGDTSFFDNIAPTIYEDVTKDTGVTLKNFAIAPDCVVSNVYPLEGNEALLGFDFLDESRPGNSEAIEAYERKTTNLTNPFPLVQGGYGMGCRSAVLLNDANGNPKRWGLVTVTIDYENLIEVLGLDNLIGMGVEYTLSYIDSEGVSHVMRESGDIDPHSVKTRFNVRNLTWELCVSPADGWVSVWKIVLSVIVIVIISSLIGFHTRLLFRFRDANGVLLNLSIRDTLTGAYNRRAYENKISEISSNPKETDLIYLTADLNGLKYANDTYGHSAGDELIIGANKCLQKVFKEYGNIYRVGGDEFAILIHLKDDNIDELVGELTSLTKEWKGKLSKDLSFCVGYASFKEHPDATIDDLIKIADERMYEAKDQYYQSTGLDRRRV